MKNQTKAQLYALAAVIPWSTVATAFKITLRDTSPLTMLLCASVTSAVFLLCHLTVTGKIILLKTLTKKDFLRCASLGLLNPFAYYLLLFNAYNLLPAQYAQTLNYLWPIALVILAVPMLKQKAKPTTYIAIFISFAGAAVILTKGRLTTLAPINLLGVTLAVASAFIWPLYWIYSLKQKRDRILTLFLNFAFGSIFLFIAAISLNKLSPLSLKAVLGSIYIGLFEMGLTFIIWLNALKLSQKTAHIANLIYLTPFFSLIFIHYILGESIHPATIIGLALIIAGILIQKSFSSNP